MKRLLTGIGLSILLFVPAIACAQILVGGEGPVVYGHHHLNTTNMDAAEKVLCRHARRPRGQASVPVTGSRRSSSSRMF